MREMTEQEEEALAALATAAKLYFALPEIHPAHPREFQAHLHDCQRLILARPAGEAHRREQAPEPVRGAVIGGQRFAEKELAFIPALRSVGCLELLGMFAEAGVTVRGDDPEETLRTMLIADPRVRAVGEDEYRRAV